MSSLECGDYVVANSLFAVAYILCQDVFWVLVLWCGSVCPFIVEEEDAGCRMSVFVRFLFLTVSWVCLQFVIAFFA